uniref:Uncharacterized protein n=1 Tax=Anguilla anguilla TaxID=7936 RepID=A0A0E9UYZ3_ANGAN
MPSEELHCACRQGLGPRLLTCPGCPQLKCSSELRVVWETVDSKWGLPNSSHNTVQNMFSVMAS